MLLVPTVDPYGEPFHPVLVDDARAAFAMYAAGSRWRAWWRLWRLSRDHDPHDVELLLFTARHAVP